MIAQAGALPEGQALEFTLPTGEPAVLVHNDKGYSAYVAICTHQGCTVQPKAGGLLECPCHGARFDANDGGSVLSGPARRPLENIPVAVGSDGNVYLAG
jgi:thiosulfate dehydrogenase [quinone] large subunit